MKIFSTIIADKASGDFLAWGLSTRIISSAESHWTVTAGTEPWSCIIFFLHKYCCSHQFKAVKATNAISVNDNHGLFCAYSILYIIWLFHFFSKNDSKKLMMQ